jgi:hypothetical protein
MYLFNFAPKILLLSAFLVISCFTLQSQAQTVPTTCPTITVTYTAASSNTVTLTNQTQPASVTLNFVNGGFMQISSLSANVPTSNLRFRNKLTSNGNVNAGGGYIVEVDRPFVDVGIDYFNRRYGPYTLLNPALTGVLSETMTPYVDANNNLQFDSATECLGQPTVLVYQIGISPIIPGPTNGLIAYYPFNGNANDGSGNNNNGVVQGVTLVQDRRGTPNGAYRFSDGTRIVVSNSPSLTLNNAYTFSGWFNLRSFEGRNGNDGGLSATAGVQTIFSKDCDRSWLYLMIIPAPDGQPRMNFSGGTWPGYLSGFARLNLNTWVHLVQTHDQGNTALYINGNMVAAGATTINFAASNQSPLIIGGMNCWPYFFNGDLDDLRFYNRGLSPAEIKQLFIAENGPIESVKAGSWTNPTTWSCNCLPTPTNPVLVRHVVNIPATQTGNALSVSYGVGGRVDLGNGAKLELVQE